MAVYYKMRQILLQNATTILLQNATKVYYKMRQVFYHKMRQFYYKMRRLLQIAAVHTLLRKSKRLIMINILMQIVIIVRAH